jgi:hypothetical protein
MAVELGSITLTHLTRVEVREHQRIVHHPVPGMSGDLVQVLGRPSVTVRLQGIFYGPTASEDLANLRSAYLAGEPIDFFTEAVGEGYFAQVVITRLQIAQQAAYTDQFDFACEVIEYVEPPAPTVSDPFGALDSDLLNEATAFMDDVQNALDQVSGLVDMITNAPSFGDPTTQLPKMLDLFKGLSSSGSGTLTNIHNLL